MRFIPTVTLKKYAAMAPPVRNSPWAKLVRPVVPKMSDRPMAPIAMTRPNCSPRTSSCSARSAVAGRLAGALAEDEQRRCDGAGTDRHLADLAAVLADGDALGERVEVERDGVVAGSGQRDGELPLRVGLAGRDLLAVLLDDDRRARRPARRRCSACRGRPRRSAPAPVPRRRAARAPGRRARRARCRSVAWCAEPGERTTVRSGRRLDGSGEDHPHARSSVMPGR